MTSPQPGGVFYCPVHGDLLDGPRSMRCERDGHEFAAFATPSPLPADEDVREAELMQDRIEWYADHEAEPRITTNAFLRGYEAGFRRSVVSTPSDVRELIEYARRRWREHQRMPGYAGVFDKVPDPELIRRLTDALEASAVSAPSRVAPITDDAREVIARAVADFLSPGGYEITESDYLLTDRILAAVAALWGEEKTNA